MNQRLVGIVVALSACYLVTPFFAGVYEIGETRGPVVYPEGYHSLLYTRGYEWANGYTPRISMDGFFYRRARFYGLDEELCSREERSAKLAEMARNGASRETLEMFGNMEPDTGR